MGLLTLFQPRSLQSTNNGLQELPLTPTWPLNDGSDWPTAWSTDGDRVPTVWDFPFGQNSPGTWVTGASWTTAMEYSNTHSAGGAVKLTRNTSTPGVGYFLNTSVPVQSNFRYAVSFWMYSTVPTSYTFKITPKSAPTVGVGPDLIHTFVPKANVWWRETFYFTNPIGSTLLDIYLTDDSNLNPQSGSSVIVDDIKLGVTEGTASQYSSFGWQYAAGGTANRSFRMDLSNGPRLDNIDAYVDVSTDLTVEKRMIVGIDGSEDMANYNYDYSTTGYAAVLSTFNDGTNSLTIRGYVQGYDTLLAGPISCPIATGTAWTRIRIKRFGNQLWAKAYQATVAEPDLWDLTANITDGSNPSGVLSLAVSADSAGNTRECYWNSLYIVYPPATETAGVRSSGGTGGSGGGGTITPVSQVGSSTLGTSAAATVTVNKPTGVVAGNLLVAFLSVNTDASILAQSGWTLRTQVGNAAGALLGVFYKIAGSSEPASYTFTSTASTSSTVILSAFSSFDATTPFDTTDITAIGASGTSLSVGPITSVTDKALLLYASAARSASDTVVADAALTTLMQATASRRVTVASEQKSPAGLSTARAFTGTTSVPRTGILVAIRPYSTAGSTKTGQIKYYDGASFTAKPVKVWTGTAWVTKPVKRWDGTSWTTTTY